MAGQQKPPLSIKASADLTAFQHCGISINASGLLVAPSAGGSILGVLYNIANAAGKPGLVQSNVGDRLQFKAGGTITPGDDLKVQADGTFITCVAGDVAAGRRVAVAITGATVGNRADGVLVGGSAQSTSGVGQEIVTAGALTAAPSTSYLSITGAQAYTLPDGLFVGQQKTVEVIVAASTPVGTLTITTPTTGEQATHVLKAVRQQLVFVWRFDGSVNGWHLVTKRRAGKTTYIVGTDSFVGNSDKNIDLSITGTKTGALPNGQAIGELICISISTAASTPVGNLTGTYRTKFGVAAANLSGLDATTDFAIFEWDGLAWQELNSTGVTIS